MVSADRLKGLIAKIKSQHTRLQVLNELANIQAATKDLNQLLKEILLLTVRSIRVQFGFVIFYNKDSINPFEYVASNTAEQFEDQALIRDMCDNVIKSRKQIIINDTAEHRRLRRCGIRNLMALPLLLGKDPIGIFIIMNKYSQSFKKRDMLLFSIICKFTAIAIENTKNYKDLEEKKKELSAIYTADRIRDTIKDFSTMMESILQELARSIDTKFAFFLMYDKKSNKTELKVSGQMKSSPFIQHNMNSLYDIARTTLNHGEMMEFRDVNRDVFNAICIPILVNDDTMGVFGVVNASSPAGFTKLDKTILKAITTQADSAVFEDLEKQEIKNAFQCYVSPEVMQEILANPDKNYLNTAKREMSVLFSDLRDFTSLSETLPPEQIVEILNEHFDTMVQIILKNKGTLDKFVGDEIMALFGAPLYTESHTLKAIKTAIEMQKAQKELSKRFKKKFGVEVNIGIGVNTGEMVIGNIGAKQRMNYTVIGDSVNVAARLCAVAQGGEILITEKTYAEVKKLVKVKELEPVRLKGKAKSVQVYRVIDIID